jgi:8-oxo-dGTP pyrophosphatase MutT (NUDIX family)
VSAGDTFPAHPWFDDDHSHAGAGVFLRAPDGRFILQLRDDKPGIEHPGMITTFGGAAEPGEAPEECARRELAEELGLTVRAGALSFVGSVSRIDFRGRRVAAVFFLLEGIDPAGLAVAEGRAIVLAPDVLRAEPGLTENCRRFALEILDRRVEP